MPCKVCDHTLHAMGCKVTDSTFFWCPRCGSIKPCDNELATPALVERCRKLYREFMEHIEAEKDARVAEIFKSLWQWLGIEESINVPEDRPH